MTSVPSYSDEAPTVVIPVRQLPPESPIGAVPPPAPAEPGDAPPRRRRTVRYLAVAVPVVLLVAGGAVAAYATAGDIARGTTVLGTDLGGMSRSQARTALSAVSKRSTAESLRIIMDGASFDLQPTEVGLALDVAATVDEAAKGRPRLFGHREVSPVTVVDVDRLEAVLRKRLDPASVTVREPAIRYVGVTPKPTYPRPGRDLELVGAAALVRQGWPGRGPVDIPLVERPPAMTREQVDALVAQVAAPAVAGPVTVRLGSRSFALTPRMIARSLEFRADAAGLLAPKVDQKKLRAAAAKPLRSVETVPQEATVTLAGGRPKVVAGTAGRVVDTGRLAADLVAVLPVAQHREVRATLKTQPAATTLQDAAKLGIKEKVSTFTTRFPGGLSSPRSQNIVTIAKEVDGALVKPGETFSLNGHTGERSYPQGYKDAPVIVGGKLEPGVAGGASQFTTTLFNAAYYAGLRDVEHKPHSFYFDRYPAVIESTIFYPDLDLKFKNTTPYGILIDTSHTGSTVTVAMWSTKYYDSVKTVRSSRRNITSPPTRYREPGPKCIATHGLPGFTQDAYRVIRKDGKEIKREKFTWHYDPEPHFICGKQPS